MIDTEFKRNRAWWPKAAEMYRAGMTMEQVGAHFGCCSSNIGHILRQMGEPRRPRSCRPPGIREAHPRARARRIDSDEAVRLYQTGLTMLAVGTALKCSHERVRQLLNERGITERHSRAGERNWAYKHIDEYRLGERYAAGLTTLELANEFGVSSATVRARLHALGLVVEWRRPKTYQKLSADAVTEIKRRLRTGEPTATIARDFGIGVSMLSHIMVGRAHADVGGPAPGPRRMAYRIRHGFEPTGATP